MHPAGKLRRIQNTGLHVFAREVRARVGRQSAIERQVAGFGAHHDFVTLQLSRFDSLPQRHTDIALRALMAVVDGGIENVDAGAQRGCDGLGAVPVGLLIRLAQVGSESDRGKPKLASQPTTSTMTCAMTPAITVGQVKL